MRAFATCLYLALALPVAATALALPGAARAQEVVFVQIEAHPNLREAQERARAYGDILPDINGFALGGGWYGLALGPYDAASARAALRRLRAEGLVPRDSYVTEGGTYRQRFWPVGADAVTEAAPEPGAEVAAPPEAERGAPDEAAAPAPREETEREALASEALLDRDAKMELQRALQWFGLYAAGIDGSFGAGTRASMAAWQEAAGVPVTGVLTTRQRARLLEALAASQAELGLERIEVAEAGLSLTAPTGLVAFDRIEAPFVHYRPRDDSGVRLSLISEAGDSDALGGLYEILQALEIVPEGGERARSRDSFRIRGAGGGRETEAFARLEGGHVLGYVLSWPDERAEDAARALVQMERTLASTGAPLDPGEGFDPAGQSPDMVSGLERRRPIRAASGFFVDDRGAVATAAANVEGCGRITLDRLHEAEVALTRDGVAVLRPVDRLAPIEVARLAPVEGRLRSPVSVGGFPYGGVLGGATLSFGTLEDVRGLDGEADALRLSVETRAGDIGGPVLDAAGRVTGMLLPDPAGDRALPADLAIARKSGVLIALLGEAGIEPRTAGTEAPIAPEDLTARAAGLTVLVSCWD